MLVFDTHCDTLTAARSAGLPLCNPKTELSPDRPMGERWCQCFAIWSDDALRGGDGWTHYRRCRRFFAEQLWKAHDRMAQAGTAREIRAVTGAGKVAAVLTVENASILEDQLERVAQLAQDGVRMVTLTWNGANALAGGHLSTQGFTLFGREAVAAMEQHGVVVDVSHLNATSFWELEQFARRPYIASHSNCHSVRPHGRNLTDDQLRAIAARGGLVAVTYHQPFVTADGQACVDDLCRHLEQLLKVGGDFLPALGSDFDGGKPPVWLCRSEQVPMLLVQLTRRFGGGLTERIAGQNALDFFKRYEECSSSAK